MKYYMISCKSSEDFSNYVVAHKDFFSVIKSLKSTKFVILNHYELTREQAIDLVGVETIQKQEAAILEVSDDKGKNKK